MQLKELLKILACPKCKGNLSLKKMFLLCKKCKLAYPIIDEVPDMLLEDAWSLERAKKENFEHKLKL
jgi:uncharacterized protein YbaR (Trm112 family)